MILNVKGCLFTEDRNTMLKVVIPEPITSLNKGEAAILRGIQVALSLNGEIDLTVYSPSSWLEVDRDRYEDEIKLVDGVDLIGCENAFLENPVSYGRMHYFSKWAKLIVYSFMARLSKKIAHYFIKDGLLSSMADSNLIIVGHDGMLSYNTFWTVLAAKIMQKPIAIFGSGNDGIGRSKKFRIRKFLQFAVNNSIICTVRDPNTKNYLIANGVNSNKVHIFPDPAFLLKPCDEERVNEIIRIESIPDVSDKPLFGLIPVMGGIVYDECFSFESDPVKRHALKVKLWVDILLHLIDTTDAHFIFIPHCIGPTDKNDDRRMSQDVYDGMPSGKDRFTVINTEYSESELKGLIKKCDYLLAERTHGLIGSVSVATPCLALTVKEDSRMHYIIEEMSKRLTFDINNPDVDALKNLLTQEWNNRKLTASKMTVEADQIHKDAMKAAEMLKDGIEVALGKL